MNNNIAAIRKQKGLLQKELAEKVGVRHWWLSEVESGKSTPSLQLLLRIANELGVTTNDLLN